MVIQGIPRPSLYNKSLFRGGRRRPPRSAYVADCLGVYKRISFVRNYKLRLRESCNRTGYEPKRRSPEVLGGSLNRHLLIAC